jgi:glycosyltransferase involved in cell wall biosynthesis
MNEKIKLMICARSHPEPVHPYRGLFNRNSFQSLAGLERIAPRVIVPKERAPPIGPYSELRFVPKKIEWPEYTAHHPRFTFLLPKRLFKYNINANSFKSNVTSYITSNFDEPDIVHTGHIMLDAYGLLEYCKDRSIPLFTMGRGHTINNYESYSKDTKNKIRTTLDYATGIFCVSDALAESVRSIVKSPASVHAVPNGVNTNHYPHERRENIRKELNIPKKDVMILFCGSFTKRKGMVEIIQVLNNCSFPKTHFIFVGHHGKYKKKLQKAVYNGDIGSASRIFWKIPPLALRRLYVGSDLLILPSHAEGRPNVIYEAMAGQTAVLATNVGGIAEQVVDGETGHLIAPESSSSLHDGLSKMIDNKKQLNAMGDAGYDRIKTEGWTWENHANIILEKFVDAM